MKQTVSVVVVARNEEHTIAAVIREALSVLPTVTRGYEILVNDDASTDQTPAILDALKRRNPHIRVYHQKYRLGIAGGSEFLYQKARLEYIFILPGDGQYSIYDLPDMLEKASLGYDIVVGKRIHKQYDWSRTTVSYLFNALSRLLFGVDTIDAGSTKLYRREVLRAFPLQSRGVYNEAERIIRATRAGYRVGAVPAHHMTRSGGCATGAKPALIWEAVVDMCRLFFEHKKALFTKNSPNGRNGKIHADE